MTVARQVEVLREKVRDTALSTGDPAEFRRTVLDVIRERIPFDRACIALVDPATLMFTAVTMVDVEDRTGREGEVVAHLEYGATPYANTYGKLARTRSGVQTIRAGVDGDVRDSLPYLQVLEPAGMDDEVRLVFRGRDGLVWGGGTLMRGPGHRFRPEELVALSGCVGDIGEGLRLSLLRNAPRLCAGEPNGPAVVIVGPADEIESATPQALQYLEQIAGHGGERMLPLLGTAIRSRHSPATTPTRIRTLDGRWLVIRAGVLNGRGSSGQVVVTLEPAQPPEILSLLGSLHGLTERESEVLGRVLTGETREAIGQRLFISPYTVQDHLKSIYAKVGVNGRQELVARLFFTQYLPHVGEEIGPDGWFATRREGARLAVATERG